MPRGRRADSCPHWRFRGGGGVSLSFVCVAHGEVVIVGTSENGSVFPRCNTRILGKEAGRGMGGSENRYRVL